MQQMQPVQQVYYTTDGQVIDSSVQPPLPPTPAPTPPPLPPGAPSLETASVAAASSVSEMESQEQSSLVSAEEIASTSQDIPLSIEARDINQEVISDEDFETRIEMVGSILNTDLPTIAKRSKAIVMSTGKKADGSECRILPPSERFPQQFDDYLAEISAAPGSHRASNPKNKELWRWEGCLIGQSLRSMISIRWQGTPGRLRQ